MSSLGARALLDIAVPNGVDANALLRFEMQDGMTAEDVIGYAANEIGRINQELLQQYGGLITVTQRPSARYRQGDGDRTMTPRATEFAEPDPVRGDKIGHMLIIDDYHDANAWSNKYLKRAVREDVRDDIMEVIDRWRNRVDYEVISRALSSTEYAVGSAGYSPGWAIGSGSSLNYIPPQWRGYTHSSSHSHYLRTNASMSSSNTATMLKNMAKELAHHGHTGRKVALVSEADLDIYLGLEGKSLVVYKPTEFVLHAGASDVTTISGELQGIPGELFAYYQTSYGIVELRYHERIPSGYIFMSKSYGVNASQNGLAIRTDPHIGGFGLYLNPQLSQSLVPSLEQLKFEATHGLNVNDRTNGVAAQIASGGTSYETPDIS